MAFSVLAFVVGLLVGSFLNVCIYRIPKGESIAYPSSHCPRCSHSLGPSELIPVGSWVFQRGRCRACGEGISFRYPLVELITALLFLGLSVILRSEPPVKVISAFTMAAILVVVSFIDLDTKRIPNVITYPAAVFFLAISSLPGGMGLQSSILGLAIGGGVLLLVVLLSKGGMGMGDAKLTAVIGAAFGWPIALYSIFLGSLLGSVIGLILLALRRIERKQPIPFGPFLAVGSCLAWLIVHQWPDVIALPF